jgi:hypothetical protein
MYMQVSKGTELSHVTTGKSSVDRQLGTSYVLATGGALVTALGLNSLVKVSVVIMSEESANEAVFHETLQPHGCCGKRVIRRSPEVFGKSLYLRNCLLGL